ncbi:MAG: glycosyltransferase family 2 protein, partial [Gammaproteobacteria bacterium]
MEIFSVIRVLGFVLGALMILRSVVSLRTASDRRDAEWLLMFGGIGCLSVSLYPGLVDIPSQLLSLGDFPGGRIITILILVIVVMWFILADERGENIYNRQRVAELITALAMRDFRAAHAPRSATGKVAVVIPALNEGESLPDVLPSIPSEVAGLGVVALIVDDGSDDDTVEVAKRLGALSISHMVNQGGGAALRTGYAAAGYLGVSVVVTMDADGQHDPSEIEPLVRPIAETGADIVIGSRVLGSMEDYSSLRRKGVDLFSGLVSLLTGVKITDCASGFRAFRYEKLKQ